MRSLACHIFLCAIPFGHHVLYAARRRTRTLRGLQSYTSVSVRVLCSQCIVTVLLSSVYGNAQMLCVQVVGTCNAKHGGR